MKRKNLGVPSDKHMKIERVAVEVTAKTGKITKWTDIVNYMIDNYINDAKQDLIHKENSNNNNRINISGNIKNSNVTTTTANNITTNNFYTKK